jgi:hypothetical protein
VAESLREAGHALEAASAPERYGIAWTVSARTPSVLVLGTGTQEEALRAAQAAHATAEVFRALFGCRVRHTKDFTIYLLADPAQRDPFLDGLPGLAPDERAFLAQLVGAGIPRTGDTGQWDAQIERRLDGAVRHTLGGFLRDEYGITTDHAWAWEGIGIYLTREIVGTRLTWYVRGTVRDEQRTTTVEEQRRDAELRTRLLGAGANWMNDALVLLRGESAPDLGKVMRRDVNTMIVSEMLVSYALSAYLLEGRPGELPELLHRVGRGEPPEEAVGAALGMTIPELKARLVRWLGERRRPEDYRS